WPTKSPHGRNWPQTNGVVMAKKRREWTKRDVRELTTLARQKAPAAKIAKSLKRTLGATPKKASELGVSLDSRGYLTAQQPYHGHRLRLLRARRQRPRRRAAEQRYELAPLHSITSSARASRVGDTSRSIACGIEVDDQLVLGRRFSTPARASCRHRHD